MHRSRVQQVTVETPAGPVVASFKDGAYRLAGTLGAADRSLDLIFTVTADDHTEILSGTLHCAPTPKDGRAQWMEPISRPAAGLKETLSAGQHRSCCHCWRLWPADRARRCCGAEQEADPRC